MSFRFRGKDFGSDCILLNLPNIYFGKIVTVGCLVKNTYKYRKNIATYGMPYAVTFALEFNESILLVLMTNKKWECDTFIPRWEVLQRFRG